MSMTKTGDSIKFEYRSEVDEIENALEIYLKEHPAESNKETVKRMIDLLEIMYLEWQKGDLTMATPNSRQQKKQKMYQLQREVEELRKQVEQQKNDDALQKVRVNISITKETKQRLKNYADYKNVSVSQAISDWIWSTRFDKN